MADFEIPTGITIHRLTAKWDAGDILLQEEIAIQDSDDLETLSMKLQMSAPRLLSSVLANIDHFWSSATPQGEGGSYWPTPSYEDRRLHWDKPVNEILRVAKAFSKFEASAVLNDKRWVVTRANGWIEAHNYTPGAIVHESNKEIVIAALNGFICLQEFDEFKHHASFP